MTEAIPAATLVLFRETGDGPAEHLFVERAATMRFAAGAIVFPGGRVDPGDRRMAETFPAYDEDDAAARICAIRESIEEGGIGAGLSPAPNLAVTERLRAGLEAGTVFADLLASEQRSLDLDALIPFARWRPNFPEARVFDTRFFLARVAADAPAARVDATENVRVFWASAQQVIDDADGGKVSIIFPTRRNLERLAALGSFDAARAQALSLPSPPPMITPWVEERDGEQHLCIPDKHGYPVTSQVMREVQRG
ncbi:Nudix hydrolase domain-containing protein [Sphingomonas antarctica]|uniref:NUDIX hydrolase n=1 Tax=Sphingomonas antarctica TaxID=2040274 RepID=UPI0039E73DFC